MRFALVLGLNQHLVTADARPAMHCASVRRKTHILWREGGQRRSGALAVRFMRAAGPVPMSCITFIAANQFFCGFQPGSCRARGGVVRSLRHSAGLHALYSSFGVDFWVSSVCSQRPVVVTNRAAFSHRCSPVYLRFAATRWNSLALYSSSTV